MPTVSTIAWAVGGIAVLVTIAAILDTALRYWPVTLAIVGSVIATYVVTKKAKDKRNQV